MSQDRKKCGWLRYLMKQFCIPKLLFGTLTAYLLYKEFYTFQFERPTYTSTSKVTIGNEKK